MWWDKLALVPISYEGSDDEDIKMVSINNVNKIYNLISNSKSNEE